MEVDMVKRISSHPKYIELKAKRTSLGSWLTLAGIVAYYGFILLVAFNKPLLSQNIGDGVTPLGMPLCAAFIIFTTLHT